MRERFGCAEGDHLCMRQFRGFPFKVQSVCVRRRRAGRFAPNNNLGKLGGVEVRNLP